MMPKFLFNSLTHIQRRNVSKWRSLGNAGKNMLRSDLITKSKDNDKDESDESVESPPPKNGKRKGGRKQRRITKTTPSGLPGDTIVVKLRNDTEEYSHFSLPNVVHRATLWNDSKFISLPGHHPHAHTPRIRRLDSIGMSRGRSSVQPYAVIDPGAVEELIGGDGWHISFISTQTETLSGALEGMGTLTLPKVDAITAVNDSKGKVMLLGVGNVTYDVRHTQYESLLNLHHLRTSGVDVQDIAKCHGGLQRLEITVDNEIHHIPLDFDGDIMTIPLRKPTPEELDTLGVVWLKPAMSNATPRSVRRSVSVQPSFQLQGIHNQILPEAEISTNGQDNGYANTIKRVDWNASLGYPTQKILEKTLETTTQLCAEPVEMEIREIPRQHRKKRLLSLHPRRLQGRVDSDTFFSSVQSRRGYKCVQLFVHVPSDYLFVRCMQRESHSHGAYQDFIREIGAPEMIATDNSQTQAGTKWETTSRKNVTKQRTFSPHNRNQNKAELRIRDVKHKTVYILEKSNAPLSFWCYALIYVIDCLNHLAKESLNWKTSYELLNGDTPDISAFRLTFWQAIEYFEPTSKFPEPTWRQGRFLGIAWDSGDAFTFKIWTEVDGDWNKGRELTRNIVRVRRVLQPTNTQHDDDLDTFYFQKKVYTNKRRGQHKNRVYKLVRIEDHAPDMDSLDSRSHESPPSNAVTVLPKPHAAPTSSNESVDVAPELSVPTENTIAPLSEPPKPSDSPSTSATIPPPLPNNIEMVNEVNDQLSSPYEDPSFGGSGLSEFWLMNGVWGYLHSKFSGAAVTRHGKIFVI